MAEDQVVDKTDTDVDDSEASPSPEDVAEKLYGENADDKEKDKGEENAEDTSEKEEQDSAEDEKSEDEKDDKDKEEGAPDEYDFTMPEGMEEMVDKDAMEAFSEFAKEHNLSQEDAQKVVDIQTDIMKRIGERYQEEYAELSNEWREAAKNDKEYGGEKFEENLGYAKKALETFGGEDLIEALEVTGMGNHPELIRFAVNVGKMISEDGVMTGNKAAKETDPAKVLFPNMA